MLLPKQLELLQEQIALKFKEIRALHSHGGNKGANVEQIVRDFLAQYLPPANRIGHGQITDTAGQLSRQTDVVILNQYHPFLNDLTQPSVFIIEGVAAVGEVKSSLTSGHLEATLKNCSSVNALQPKKTKGTTVFSTMESIERFLENTPYFLFAFESQLTLDTIGQQIEVYNTANDLPLEKQLDAVFVLDRGTIFNIGNDSGLKIQNPDGSQLTGYVKRSANVDLPIANLLLWLTVSMQNPDIVQPPIVEYLMKQPAG